MDKSLVLVQTHGEGMRYLLLETVRQYAFNRLVESGEILPVRARYGDCFLALAEEANSKWIGPVYDELSLQFTVPFPDTFTGRLMIKDEAGRIKDESSGQLYP